MSNKVNDKDLEKVSGGLGQGGELSKYIDEIKALVDNSNELFAKITADIVIAILTIKFQSDPKAKLSEIINQINVLIGTNPSERELLEQLKSLVEKIMDYVDSTKEQG